MPRTCTICTHAQRQEIDSALLSGDSLRDIARQFRVSKDPLSRHKSSHLGERMVKVAEHNAEADIRTAIDVVRQLRAINDAAIGVLKQAKNAGDGALTLQATDRILKQIELQAKLIDLISDGTTVNVVISPQWIEIRTAIVGALADDPEARLKVVAAIQAIEGGNASAYAA